MAKFYLRKNDKNIEINKTKGDDRLPYFSLFSVPEKEGGEWLEIGAAWKSKSGKGYNVAFAKGFEFSTTDIKPYKKTETNGD